MGPATLSSAPWRASERCPLDPIDKREKVISGAGLEDEVEEVEPGLLQLIEEG